MKIKVRYFGRLTDLSGTQEETIHLDEGADIEHLLQQIESKHPALNKEIKSMALNGQITWENEKLHDGDEIDLFPPFAGG